jgi:hypothetical protein
VIRYYLEDATASFRFNGSSITWYTVTSPDQGLANVYIDGTRRLDPGPTVAAPGPAALPVSALSTAASSLGQKASKRSSRASFVIGFSVAALKSLTRFLTPSSLSGCPCNATRGRSRSEGGRSMHSGTTFAFSKLLASAPASKFSYRADCLSLVTQTMPKLVSSSDFATASSIERH